MQEGNSAAAKTSVKVCPECGGPMVQRTSKFGPFLGCGTFPKCKFIERT